MVCPWRVLLLALCGMICVLAQRAGDFEDRFCQSRSRWSGGIEAEPCRNSRFQDRPVSPATTQAVPKWTLVVLVMSARPHFVQRRLIRETWANTTAFKTDRRMPNATFPERTGGTTLSVPTVKVLFVVGMPRDNVDDGLHSQRLQREQVAHHDLVLVPVADVYSNLIYKLVCALDDISSSEYNSTSFVMKVDDDTYLDLPPLLFDLVHPRHPRKLHLQGQIWKSPPIRNSSHKNWVSEAYYPMDTHLPYAHGAHYLLSKDVVDFIVRNERYLNPSIIPHEHRGNLEDVRISTWAFAIGCKMVHDTRFVESYNCHSQAISLSDVPHHLFKHIHDTISKRNGSGMCAWPLHEFAVSVFQRRAVSGSQSLFAQAAAHNNAGAHFVMLGSLRKAYEEFLLAHTKDQTRTWSNLQYFDEHPDELDCAYDSACGRKLRRSTDVGLQLFAHALAEP